MIWPICLLLLSHTSQRRHFLKWSTKCSLQSFVFSGHLNSLHGIIKIGISPSSSPPPSPSSSSSFFELDVIEVDVCIDCGVDIVVSTLLLSSFSSSSST